MQIYLFLFSSLCFLLIFFYKILFSLSFLLNSIILFDKHVVLPQYSPIKWYISHFYSSIRIYHSISLISLFSDLFPYTISYLLNHHHLHNIFERVGPFSGLLIFFLIGVTYCLSLYIWFIFWLNYFTFSFFLLKFFRKPMFWII